MNILFLINFAGRGGSEKYVDNLQRIYTEGGDKCFLVYNVEGQLSENMKRRGVSCLRLDLTRAAMNASAKKLAAFCSENSVDVIHAQFPVENIIAIKSLKYYDKPKVVFTSHISRRQGFRWKLLNRVYTRKNHAVVSVCDDGAEKLVADGISRDKIRVIYNGVIPNDELRSFPASDPFKMCIAARYSPEKGLDFLVDVLREIKRRSEKKFICTIVGDGDGFAAIKEKIHSLGLAENVIQAGYITDVKRFLAENNLYLNTSSVEAMSLAVLEAMNEGLAVVASDAGANKFMIEDDIVCGKVVKYGDIGGFADAVLEYMNNDDLLRIHSAAAHEKIKKKFDLRKLAADTRAVYK